MVTWGLGGLWHGDFRPGDLGLKGTFTKALHCGMDSGLNYKLGDLGTWRIGAWGLGDLEDWMGWDLET